jgi:hypothetical protein
MSILTHASRLPKYKGMSSENKNKVLGPDLYDTRLRNQFLKVGRLNHKDLNKQLKEIPDDSEWASWVPLEQIIKENDDDSSDVPSSH